VKAKKILWVGGATVVLLLGLGLALERRQPDRLGPLAEQVTLHETHFTGDFDKVEDYYEIQNRDHDEVLSILKRLNPDAEIYDYSTPMVTVAKPPQPNVMILADWFGEDDFCDIFVIRKTTPFERVRGWFLSLVSNGP
jgi:hypothetical protein